ncbi:Tex family protein [Algivirga pacifica]|uniref:Tex family protein n=1 Tax=Algivirga pacifica TaxID=1162670 RepID=A0ABP9D0Q5_9BACT
MENNILVIAGELNVRPQQVEATVKLLDEGATVPFISRYRKEATGSLDEVAVAAVRDRMTQLRELDKRRESILKSIEEQGKLTDELKKKIEAADTMAVLEDIYLPYKPKRKTRASVAKEKGLEPLAETLFNQEDVSLEELAKPFLDEEKGVKTVEEALAGARDIIAEKVNEDQEARKAVRHLFEKQGTFSAKVIPGKEEEGAKYKDYFEWSEPIEKAPSHRILAMRRAEKEMIISLDCTPEEEEAIYRLEDQFVQGHSEAAQQVKLAVRDSYKRLMKPSLETEIRINSKKRADEEAIHVFAENLRQLLLSAPLGQKNVLAIDPAYRTGCKTVVLDKQGKLLYNTVIYPLDRVAQATATVKDLCKRYDIEAIAIGNGTASRETERFVRGLNLAEIQVIVVNESGASVYSASEVAREEFPDYDVTVRGAVSIGRRLMDPLAELVKIDPKSIGVGQYQHDVDQTLLKNGLDDVVVSCVNKVGVEVNTASKELLTYVSGLGATIAKNIVNYRNENGPFKSRTELKKVARLGPKAFEQSAGFLRVRGSKNPLDQSAVHPESYTIVQQMAKDLNCTVQDLMDKQELRAQIDLKKYVTDTVGLPTLTDILQELAKPGRDPREQFETFEFADDVNEMEDLKIGMKLPGIVTNITNFGAFVDIGVHQDGLVHVSELSDDFVDDPNEVVKVQQQVEVTVLEVDIRRKRISLSMKTGKPSQRKAKRKQEPQREAEKSMDDMLAMLKAKFK